MSKTIHKYEITPGMHDQWHTLQKGARILSVGNQRERLVFWVEVDPDAETERRRFVAYGSGHQMPDNPGTYLGTAIFMEGGLVFHAYKVTS